jgi:hypothetical protein
MEAAEFFKRLADQNLTELERKTGVTRQALHNARRTENMKLDNLCNVAQAMNLQVDFQPAKTESNLLSSLVDFGVPVAHSGGGTLSFSEAVGEGLLASRKDGAYESFIPYLMIVNADKLDPLALAAVAFKNKEVNVLGYFAEMANAFSPHPNFDLLFRILESAKVSAVEFLVEGKKSFYPELFEKNPLALKWNLRVRGNPNDHFERWKKWQQSQERN